MVQAISSNKLIMKTENGGFSTFAGVFDPGRGRIGPTLLQVRLDFLRRIQRRWPFLQERSLKF